MSGDRGILPQVDQPWGFDGVRREYRTAQGDSRIFYVDPNHPEATDRNSGEDPAHPLATIQQAVALCRADRADTIYVMQSDGWQYGPQTAPQLTETVVIPSTRSGIRLFGVGGAAPGVYWCPAGAGDFALSIYALDVVVGGFLYNSPVLGGNGIYVEWDGALDYYADNVDVIECTFDGSLDIGVQMEYVWYGKVERCHFDHLQAAGIYVDPLGSGIDYCSLMDNWFRDCTAAISGQGAENCRVGRNQIFNANAQAGAAATDEGIVLGGVGGDNLVFDNFFSCLLPAAAPGDFDDLNTAGATDAWVNNHCMDGDAVTNPT